MNITIPDTTRLYITAHV